MGQLIQMSAKANPPSGLVETIHSLTEGNPLFVTEVVRILDQELMEEGREHMTSIPEGVRNAIGRRLNGVSAGCN